MIAAEFSARLTSTGAALALLAGGAPIDATLAAETPLHEDDFSDDLSNWVIEAEDGGDGIRIDDGRLRVFSTAGATIWFEEPIEGPVVISFDAMMVDLGGRFDRVSDLNMFWSAREPSRRAFFDHGGARNGRFSTYDALELYYVGFGGNHNTTTRFRRYVGEAGKRPLLPEHDLADPRFLNRGNVWRRVEIHSVGARQRLLVDGAEVFDFTDPAPYRGGYFGFRTVRNHMLIDNFAVRHIETWDGR